MNMKIAKPTKWSLIFILVIAAGVLFFAIRMYQDDIKAIKGFMASYADFDKAISDLSMTGTDDSMSKAGNAAADLNAKASLRLSSLIKNDGELMIEARQIADLSRSELEGLKARDAGLKDRDPNPDMAKGREPDKGIEILREKRRAAYARFRELGGVR
jgi:hypothetical protein